MPSYHAFTEDGHYCPTCKAGPFLCYMEDGQCDNNGTCDKCIQAQWNGMDSEEREYRQEMQERYDDLHGAAY